MIFIYLKGTATQRERSSILWFTPIMATIAKFGVDQAQEVSYMCGWGPTTWAIVPCLPRYVSRKLDRKRAARDSQGLPLRGAGITGGDLTSMP